MALDSVRAVIDRAIQEPDFQQRLADHPYDALAAYQLEPTEEAALVAASEPDLVAAGVEPGKAAAFVSLFHISRGGGGD